MDVRVCVYACARVCVCVNVQLQKCLLLLSDLPSHTHFNKISSSQAYLLKTPAFMPKSSNPQAYNISAHVLIHTMIQAVEMTAETIQIFYVIYNFIIYLCN